MATMGQAANGDHAPTVPALMVLTGGSYAIAFSAATASLSLAESPPPQALIAMAIAAANAMGFSLDGGMDPFSEAP